MEPRKTPDEWLQDEAYRGIQILDPDGWDRRNFESSWSEPITQQEFEFRLVRSTCQFPPGYFHRSIEGGY